MSILKAMQCYATGQLSKLSDDELEHMQDTVITKIKDVENMARLFDIGPELRADARTYALIRETIAVELEGRHILDRLPPKTKPGYQPGPVSNNNLMN